MSPRHSTALDRRDFMKGATAGLLLVPRPEPRALGSRRFRQGTTVALVRTDDRAYAAGLRTILKQG